MFQLPTVRFSDQSLSLFSRLLDRPPQWTGKKLTDVREITWNTPVNWFCCFIGWCHDFQPVFSN